MSASIPSTSERVPANTPDAINRRIREQTEKRVTCIAAGGQEAIDRRLAELDREWDIERTLELNAAIVSMAGVLMGLTGRRVGFLLPGVVAAFLGQHTIQGWCPPIPVFRRLGFRTAGEIDHERYALKVMRGDFRDLPADRFDAEIVHSLLESVRR